MTLYEQWLKMAYNSEGNADKQLWDRYLPIEQAVYEKMLATGVNSIKGTVKELAEKFNMTTVYVCGFVDGINGCLENEVDLQVLEEDSPVELKFEFEALYRKMVEYKAEHLYNLPQWDNVLDAAARRDLYYDQKKSGTVVKDAKPGRNMPCPCGSGKKFKKCCGA